MRTVAKVGEKHAGPPPGKPAKKSRITVHFSETNEAIPIKYALGGVAVPPLAKRVDYLGEWEQKNG